MRARERRGKKRAAVPLHIRLEPQKVGQPAARGYGLNLTAPLLTKKSADRLTRTRRTPPVVKRNGKGGWGRGGEGRQGGGGGGWRGKRGGASGSARALYVQPLPAQRWCLCFWRCSAAKCWAALVGAVRPPTPPADPCHSLTRATACADGGCGLVKGPAAARALRGGEGDRYCMCSGAWGSAQTLASHTATLRCVYRCAFCHVPRPLPPPPPPTSVHEQATFFEGAGVTTGGCHRHRHTIAPI